MYYELAPKRFEMDNPVLVCDQNYVEVIEDIFGIHTFKACFEKMCLARLSCAFQFKIIVR